MKGVAGAPMFVSAFRENAFMPNKKTKRPADAGPALVFFKNEPNEFAFLTNLGKAHYKFADIGELLAIRSMVDETNPASFVQAYVKFADNCKNAADQSIKNGQMITAREAYARAATYYYAALDYLDAALQSDRFHDIFMIHRKCWKSAAELMDFKYEEFSIPYEGTSLAGFFMSHKNDHSPRPLCIFNNGSDGSIVDAWTLGGAAMYERGYNLLTFDGPGQGSSLFEKNMYFLYDWEKVITL
jgi:Esterase FrsA-like